MTDANETAKEEAIKIPDVLPVLPLKDLVIFPFIIVPLSVSREKSINAVDQALGKNISPEVMVIAATLDDPARLTDLAASNLDLKLEEAQQILETIDPVERLKRVNELLTREINLLTMQQEISSAAQGEMNKSQREYFLRQQLRSEEHTSELQSQSNLVCRLLLEKKKNKIS